MKLEKIVSWLDATLNVAAFDDVSNNGLQLARDPVPSVPSLTALDSPVNRVAFAVDASFKSVRAAAAAGAQLLVVHHGLSWGGGIRRLTGGVYNVVRAAMDANLAIYASHLPLDAHPKLGNNAQLAKLFGLTDVKPAFSYHGNVIGCIGTVPRGRHGVPTLPSPLSPLPSTLYPLLSTLSRIGVCSGGAGSFAEDAKRLGCDLYVTGEADWGEVIAAENCGMRMVCLGHYETEVWGVRALAREMAKKLKVKTMDLTK